MISIRFDSKWKEDIADERKKVTIRDAATVEELKRVAGSNLVGHTLTAVDDDGNAFADLYITDLSEMLAADAYVRYRDDSDYPCPRTLTDWLADMRGYYPNLRRDSRVGAFRFKLMRWYA